MELEAQAKDDPPRPSLALQASCDTVLAGPTRQERDGGSSETWATILEQTGMVLSLIWLLGSGIIFVWSLVRVYRFNRMLRMESEVAPQTLQTIAAGIANRLKIKAVPRIYTTSAHLSLWCGGLVEKCASSCRSRCWTRCPRSSLNGLWRMNWRTYVVGTT